MNNKYDKLMKRHRFVNKRSNLHFSCCFRNSFVVEGTMQVYLLQMYSVTLHMRWSGQLRRFKRRVRVQRRIQMRKFSMHNVEASWWELTEKGAKFQKKLNVSTKWLTFRTCADFCTLLFRERYWRLRRQQRWKNIGNNACYRRCFHCSSESYIWMQEWETCICHNALQRKRWLRRRHAKWRMPLQRYYHLHRTGW